MRNCRSEVHVQASLFADRAKSLYLRHAQQAARTPRRAIPEVGNHARLSEPRDRRPAYLLWRNLRGNHISLSSRTTLFGE